MTFIHEDSFLSTRTARRLYHETAAALPVIDYHCHLSPRDLAEDRRFENITDLWIASDPYKHRAMRIAGVSEAEITGPSSSRAKFDHWASTVPLTLGNPLYSWTALELARYFGVTEPLNSESAERIWDVCNFRLQGEGGSARALLERSPAELVCTSDRLCDDLSFHACLAESGLKVRVLPSVRADDIVAVSSPNYPAWVSRLGEQTGLLLNTWDAFGVAVRRRLDAFGQLGCRLADHALNQFAYFSVTETETAELWERRLGSLLSAEESLRLQSGLLSWLGREYARRNWILQLHLGVLRATSTRLRRMHGEAGGFAGIDAPADMAALCAFLDDLEQAGSLPRTILCTLNPALNASLAVMTGSFSEDHVAGKIQFGPAWWYNDHEDGIRAHLEALAAGGLLSVFVGMTTDSRSLVSMVRHEYFRRVLCDWIGRKVELGSWPSDFALLQRLIANICHDNAAHWLSPCPAPASSFKPL